MVSGLILLPLLAVGLGLGGTYVGWKRRAIHAQMSAVDPTPVRQLAEPGPVEVEGKAVASEGTTESPVTGTEAVAAAWTVEEWDERGDSSNWREVARGIEMAPFTVDDGTGTVAVAPVSKQESGKSWTGVSGVSANDGVRLGDLLLEFERFPTRTEFGPDEDRPGRIARLESQHGLDEPGSITNLVDVGRKHGRRRFSAQAVTPGEDVYLMARFESRGDQRQRLHPEDGHLTTPEEDLLILSDQDEHSIESEFESAYRLFLYGGLAAVAVGLALGAWLVLPL